MGVYSKEKKIQHLYLRAGFGISVGELERIKDKPLPQIASDIINSSNNYTPLTIDHGASNIKNYLRERRKLSQEKRKELLRTSRQNIAKYNAAWIGKMAEDKSQLRERMTFFWHDHFACRNIISVYNEKQNNTLRKHALGKFGDLVHEMAKDPAMLLFLNNQQNKKQSSNENFARELLELFTIGIGNYTEKDIKNAARAFTGWGIGADGEFRFRQFQHDYSEKSFMGKTRNLNGDDIINIILEDKHTAVNIAGKIYKYFVNEKEDAEIINSLAEDFFRSDYNVEKLMKNIFTSDWFYNDENIGTRIKSPVDLLAGMMRSCNIKFKNHIALIGIQKILGQMLLNPPNVSGWPSGTKWIDTSSIMFRMKLPEIVFKSSEIEFDFKDETAGDMDNEMILEMSKVDKKLYKQVKTSIDLRDYYKVFSGQGTEASVDSLSKFVLQPEITQKEKELITKYADTTSGDNLVESVLMKLMSLPEYQMC